MKRREEGLFERTELKAESLKYVYITTRSLPASDKNCTQSLNYA